jgi:hypothetical protein
VGLDDHSCFRRSFFPAQVFINKLSALGWRKKPLPFHISGTGTSLIFLTIPTGKKRDCSQEDLQDRPYQNPRIGKAVSLGNMAEQLPEAEESHTPSEKPRNSAEIERRTTSASIGSSTGSSISDYDPQVHRLQSRNTELDLERHRTGTSRALSRTETQRAQHALTVGESLQSRPSRAPLPAFGGGKPYPPPLPEREDYVVEFDGPNDPLYPLNWPLKRK